MHNNSFLSFDFGLRRIGVAVGQSITYSASPLPPLLAINGTPEWPHIQKLIHEWVPKALIVGHPLAINDSKLSITLAAEAFAEELSQRFHLPVHLVDERLSTKEARTRLFEQGGAKKLKKGLIDSVSACIILEQWLTSQE